MGFDTVPLSERFPCTVWACPALRETLDNESISKIEKLANVLFQCLYIFPIICLAFDVLCNIGFEAVRIYEYFCPIPEEDVDNDLLDIDLTPSPVADEYDRLVAEINESMEKAKAVLEQRPETILLVDHLNYSDEERFELAKFALERNGDSFLIWADSFKLTLEHAREYRALKVKMLMTPGFQFQQFRIGKGANEEEEFERVKFLAQRHGLDVRLMNHCELTQEHRYELFKIGLQQESYGLQANIHFFNLTEKQKAKLAKFSQRTIEAHRQKFISESNARKDANAPNCLILQAKSDHNGAFLAWPMRSSLREIGKTHRIALKVINHANIRAEIANAKQEMGGRSVDLLILRGHGTPDGIHFGQQGQVYELANVSASDFENVHPHGMVISESCSTGALNGIAQKISNVFDGTVFAPLSDAVCYEIRRIENGFIPSFYDGGQSVTRQYRHGLEVVGV